MLRERQTSDTVTPVADRTRRVNLLNWDGKGSPEGLFPHREEQP
jgi:nitrate reductase beta subunit